MVDFAGANGDEGGAEASGQQPNFGGLKELHQFKFIIIGLEFNRLKVRVRCGGGG